MRYFKAEHLKCKRTMTNKLLWITPLLTAFLAVFMGGFYGYQYMTFYWWYTFLLPGFIAVLCALSEKREERAGKYYGVLSLPIDLWKLQWAKVMVLVEKLILAGLWLGCLATIGNLLAPTLAVYSPLGCVLGSVGIIGASLWQISLFYFLVRRFGIFLPLIVNVVLSIASPIVLGSMPLWWIWPYCWAPKLAEGCLEILLNGTYEVGVRNWSAVLVALLLSACCFVLLSWIMAGNFADKESKR